MDSRNDCRCRWEDEAKKIRGFIEESVGYQKTDKQMLSAIASGCLERVLPTMEAEGRGHEAATMPRPPLCLPSPPIIHHRTPVLLLLLMG